MVRVDSEGAGGRRLLLAVALALAAASFALGTICGLACAASAAAPVSDVERRPIVYDRQADGPTARQARSDGPIYNLPVGISQDIVCDELNRKFLLLTRDEGGIAFVPLAEPDGSQSVMPQE